MKVLFMCTHNSCRSILSEALFNHLAPEGMEAVSSGSFPSGKVNERALNTLEAAGSSLDAVTQVLIYVTDRKYLATVNSLYTDYFQAPYPNRAAIVVAGLAREEMLVELVVYACL